MHGCEYEPSMLMSKMVCSHDWPWLHWM